MKTQEQLVLAHLKDGSSLSPLEAIGLYSIFRLAAVIHRLRADGWDIPTDNKVVYDQYDRPKPYARYAFSADQMENTDGPIGHFFAIEVPAPEAPHRLNVPPPEDTPVVPYKAQVGDIVKIVKMVDLYGIGWNSKMTPLVGDSKSYTVRALADIHGHPGVRLKEATFLWPVVCLEPVKSQHQFAQAFAKLLPATRASLQ